MFLYGRLLYMNTFMNVTPKEQKGSRVLKH